MANDKEDLKQERWELLADINSAFEKPMIIFSFIWLWLLVRELTIGLSPTLFLIEIIIWILFIINLIIELIIAPDRTEFIKSYWLMALSMLLPGLGVLRLFRIFSFLNVIGFIRTFNLVRLIATIRHGMRTLEEIMRTHGLGYIIALTILVIFLGAAGMAYFENPEFLHKSGHPNIRGLPSYWDALWWTAMLMTTMGSDYWPKTIEGRILCWLLAVYAFTFFSYITATIASIFIRSSK